MSNTDARIRAAARLLHVDLPGLGSNDAQIEVWKNDILRRAWLSAVRDLHPDRAGPGASAELTARRTVELQAVNAAYDLLKRVKIARGVALPVAVPIVQPSNFCGTVTTVTINYAWPGTTTTWGRTGAVRGRRPGE